MRAAKFESRRANSSNTSISPGGETGSQRPVDADQNRLPNGFLVSPGPWPSHPHQQAPSAPIEAARGPGRPRGAPPGGEAPRAPGRPAPVGPRRPGAARPPPVPQYRSTAPVEPLPRTGPPQPPPQRVSSPRQPEGVQPYRS